MTLALSPHLDDAVFSCGGYLYRRTRAGVRVRIVTVFTASVTDPAGFALACQLDKGLTGEVDYMKLRRAEDRAACNRLGADVEHWNYREAPHRGYDSAADLFTGIGAHDNLDTGSLTQDIRALFVRYRPTEVLYPYGAGDHVDHLQLMLPVEALRPDFPEVTFRQYYDMPYARRHADRYPELGRTVRALTLDREAAARKFRACADYATQVRFQFGGMERIAAVLGASEYLR